ncbi:MAG TPA: hypothetical protein VMT43_07435, partial [Acidimicrobiales bacterium]|nr:hypothetical protein [Acidimicrobiales bacterium]
MSDRPHAVFRSSPFQPFEGSSLLEGGEIRAERGYRNGERDDLGMVSVSSDGPVALWSRADLNRYRAWMNEGLDAAER